MASITSVAGCAAQRKHNIVSLEVTEMDPATGNTINSWTELIRSNLAKLASIETSDSDSDSNSEQIQTMIDEEVLNAPRRKSPREALARAIANQLYPTLNPDSPASIIQYEKDIVKLRSQVIEQRRNAIAKATQRNARASWIKRIDDHGAWDEEKDPLSLKGASSLPMPVEVSDKHTLAPFFAHLKNGGTHQPDPAQSASHAYTLGTEPYYDVELIEFEKGVLYSDGRVDLCKMVTGPRNIGDLMESLKSNKFSKHFLLGNNIIGPTGARAISNFIDAYPDRFETWYLAGNCINGTSFNVLVNSMVASKAITNVWLKRNPLGADAAKDVFRLVTQTKNLRTIDLDQTELGDAGVADLFAMLAKEISKEKLQLALRHIYLNATGIGERACAAIAQFLACSNCTLHSLYMSHNPVGDKGAAALAGGLRTNTSLKRLSLQSCGLKDITSLVKAITDNNKLEMLDIGQAYATEDLGMRYNWIADSDILRKLVTDCTSLKYLNISYTPLTQTELKPILSAIAEHPNLLYFFAKPLRAVQHDYTSVKVGQEYSRFQKLVKENLHANVKKVYGDEVGYNDFENKYKRFVVSPMDVRLIDSVYRNRDAGMARRGQKFLVKKWEADDDTLERVQDGNME